MKTYIEEKTGLVERLEVDAKKAPTVQGRDIILENIKRIKGLIELAQVVEATLAAKAKKKPSKGQDD